jgi:hypothetical protein
MFTLVFALAANAQTEPMTGAYGALSVTSRAAKDAAAVAIRKYSSTHKRDKLTLVKIVKAERQVVAGMNYRVCMIVKNRRGVRRNVTAVVYETPNGFMRSTDWRTGNCN